jgi:hypothetical protein
MDNRVLELRQVLENVETTCVGCGCTDLQACAGGCQWIAIDEMTGFGICSNCAILPLDDLVERSRMIFTV